MPEQQKNNVTGVSVIICIYNSGSKLVPTLSYLAKQKKIVGVEYELLIVDNNCDDNSVQIAQNTWKDLMQPFPQKILKQPISGLNYARELGLRNAMYDYIVFCDDDNWLCKDYLSIVYNIFNNKPEVAMIGGTGQAELENEAPEWFQESAGFGYAIGNEGRQTGYTDSVYGAGMAVRKEMVQALNDGHISLILSDRVGKNLSSGGDSEMSVLVRATGKKIWFDERLNFGHELPQSRITWPYYRRLRYAFGCAGVYLNLYNEEFKKPGKKEALKNLIYYCARYSHLILLGYFLKKEKYAYAMQQFGRLATLYFDNDKLEEKLPVAVSNKRYLATIVS